ncbi:MAG: glycosyltransferase family 39 protein [Anaerolineae bacterium]|nr:glycosyltransferase family 39 protein [Anaerolineae bacterium]
MRPIIQRQLFDTVSHTSPAIRAAVIDGLTAAAVGLMIVSGYNFRWDSTHMLPYIAAWLMLGGGVLLWIVLLAARPTIPTLSLSANPAERTPLRWPLLAAGALALAIFAEVNANWAGFDWRVSYHMQMALFATGTGLVLCGLGGERTLWHLARACVTHRSDALTVALVTLAALIVRVWRLSTALHVMIDELHFIDAVIRLWDYPDTRLLMYVDHIAAFTHIFPYFQTWTVELLGPDLDGVRLTSAIVGTATVPALYLLARALYDRQTALIAAVMLAAFPPHIHFSRLALNNIADPLFGVLALAFLARGLKTNRPGDYVVSGVMLGLAQYFYEGGRLVFTGVFVGWVVVVIVLQRPRQHRSGLVRLVIAVVLVAAPLYYVLLSPGYSLIPRYDAQATHRSTLVDLVENEPLPKAARLFFEGHVRPALLHIMYSPDSSQFYYGGSTALLLWYITPAFLLGIVVALWRWRLSGILLLGWVAAVVCGNSLLQSADWPVRFVPVFPALALLAAVGLRHTLPLIWSRGRWQRLVYPALVILVIALALLQVSYYFGPHLNGFNADFRRNNRDFYDPLYRAKNYPPGTHIYYVSNDVIFRPVINSTLRFWDLDFEVSYLEPDDLLHEVYLMSRDRTVLLFVEPDDTQSLMVLYHRFDDLQGPIWSTYNTVAYDRQYVMFVLEPTISNP